MAQTPTELIETFPEALPMIKRNLKIWRQYRTEAEPLYSQLLDLLIQEVYASKTHEVQKGIDFMKRHFYDRPVGDMDRQINRLKHLQNFYEHYGKPVAEGTVSEEDIARAKAYPMPNVLEMNRSGFFVCPFHEDSHPSMKYYEDNNKGHCFVENKSYDVVDVVMKMNGMEFIEAIKYILKR